MLRRIINVISIAIAAIILPYWIGLGFDKLNPVKYEEDFVMLYLKGALLICVLLGSILIVILSFIDIRRYIIEGN